MTDSGLFAHPARVVAPGDVSPADLIALIRENAAFDPAILDGADPFTFWAEISSNRMDAYYTRMHLSSLENYARDAEAGVAFQNSHRHGELPLGRSIAARLDQGVPEIPRTLAAFYTLPGLNLNGLETDDLIAGIRAGIVSDVSIGFYGGEYACSVCGRDMLRDWDCWHVPGFHYAAPDDNGDAGEQVLAFAWVKNARLAEVSAVYDGATPGAAILKATQEAEAGRLNASQTRILEQRYRINLAPRRVYAGADLQTGGRNMEGKDKQKPAEAPEQTPAERAAELADLRSIAARLDAVAAQVQDWGKEGDALEGRINALIAQAQAGAMAQERILELEAQIGDLSPLAADGRAYRGDLVEEALAEGVRAMGANFQAETYRGILEAAPLETIKRFREDWATVAAERFPSGAQVRDHSDDPAQGEKRDHVPAGAYAA